MLLSSNNSPIFFKVKQGTKNKKIKKSHFCNHSRTINIKKAPHHICHSLSFNHREEEEGRGEEHHNSHHHSYNRPYSYYNASKGLTQGDSIGAEYGEGFDLYRIRDGIDRVDVEKLNVTLKTRGAERLRHTMKPDEAFGAIFSFDGVIADTKSLKRESWQKLAEEHNLEFPKIARPQIFELSPERAMMEVLLWTRDVKEARELSYRLSEIYLDMFSGIDMAQGGVLEWLQSLESQNIPCAVVSVMERQNLNKTLEKIGLRDYFLFDVAHEDGMDTIAQRFLSAAVKMTRPPNKCIVFDNTPKGIAAAHNCTMKAVAVQGDYKGYELKQADLTCSSLNELTIYNLRRLFSNRGAEFMDYHKEQYNIQPRQKQTQVIFNYEI